MHSAAIVNVLQRQRDLLEDFIRLSEQQLPCLKSEKTEEVDSVLQLRADLMIELMAIDFTLGTWIDQFNHEKCITSETIQELRSVNSEIISMANLIVEIDDQMQTLDLIRGKMRNGSL